jgi:hypothetical protein
MDKVIHTPATGGAMALLCLNAYTGVFTRNFWSYFVSSNIQYLDILQFSNKHSVINSPLSK